MLARVVPSAALAALASPVAPRVALLRIGRVLLTAEAPRAAGRRPTVEVRRIGDAASRTVEVRRIGGAASRLVGVRRIGGAALRTVEVHRIGGAAPVAVALVGPISIGQLIAPRHAKQVLQSGIRPPSGEEGPTGEEGTSVVEANSPDTEVDRPGIHRWHVEVGAGRRRPNRAVMLIARNLMLRQMATRSPYYVMVKDVASAAKTGSGFRRRFREPVLRLVVRLRIGFEPDVSLSTAN